LITSFVDGTVWRGLGLPEDDRLLVVDGRVVEWDDSVVADEVVDLAGGFLGPAFGDGHAHPIMAGLEQQGPRVREGASVAEIVDIVGSRAAANPDSPWIVGGTRGVAYQARSEKLRGTLVAGAESDLVWLSADPRTVDIADIAILGTWLAGRQTFSHPHVPTTQECAQ
jgi:predicted amidohydrolase YtcJ